MRESNWDPAEFIRCNKTHRSVAEAFKDPTYAEPLWRCESDTSRAVQWFMNMFGWLCVAAICGFVTGLYIK